MDARSSNQCPGRHCRDLEGIRTRHAQQRFYKRDILSVLTFLFDNHIDFRRRRSDCSSGCNRQRKLG